MDLPIFKSGQNHYLSIGMLYRNMNLDSILHYGVSAFYNGYTDKKTVVWSSSSIEIYSTISLTKSSQILFLYHLLKYTILKYFTKYTK